MKNHKKNESKNENEKGAALVFVIMVFVVLSLLGTAILGTVTANHRMTIEDQEFQSIYYIAESGARYQMEMLQNEIQKAYEENDHAEDFYRAIDGYSAFAFPYVMEEFETVQGAQPRATITMERLSPSGSPTVTYQIISRGELDGKQRRVYKEITIQWVPKQSFAFQADMAVFTNSHIILENGTVRGGLGTNGLNAIHVTGNPTIDDIYLLEGGELQAPDWWKNQWDRGGNHQITLESPRTFSLPSFPDVPIYNRLPDTVITNGSNQHKVIDDGSINITNYLANNYTLLLLQNAYIPQININSNRILNIDIGDKDRTIVVNQLNLDAGHINVIGSGTLTIYLRDHLLLTGGSGINRPMNEYHEDLVKESINKLRIYYKGRSDRDIISMGGAQKIYGSLYAENTNIELSEGAGFQGHIITGGSNVTIQGGTSVVSNLIYAPNASVRVGGGASIKGPVISNDFILSGGATIIFDPSDVMVENPFEEEASGDNGDLIIEESVIREE